MAGTDPDEAARALTLAHEGLRRGARVALPRWYAVVTCALATLYGAAFDIPVSFSSVGWFLRQGAVWTILAGWFFVSRVAWRVRPRPLGFGWRVAVVFYAGFLALYSMATGLGLALRAAAVPFPFALAGLAFGVCLVIGTGLLSRRLNAIYRDRIAQGKW